MAGATFTVDVEADWAGTGTRGIREALPRLVNLLDRHGATATFFVVAELVDLVTPILPPGGPHEVGSHGLTHRTLTRLAPDEARREVVESKRRLENAGYSVEGFRAPYFARPAGLGEVLADAGYRYDASVGALHPLRRPRVPADEPLPVVGAGTLRDGRTPFALTYLRLVHPLGLRLVGPDPGTFWCHPHELVEHTAGWTRLPPGVRHLHRRASGTPAWGILERLLSGLRFTSIRARS